MNVLIRKSKVYVLESDQMPFSHNLDQYDDYTRNGNKAAVN